MATGPTPRLLTRYQRENAAAQRTINPDTGKPFKNRNDRDTWRRNQKAKAQGFTSRAQQRRAREKAQGGTATQKLIAQAQKFKASFKKFRAGRRPTKRLAQDFIDAFGTQGPATRHQRIVRADYLDSDKGADWDWATWQEEYQSVY